LDLADEGQTEEPSIPDGEDRQGQTFLQTQDSLHFFWGLRQMAELEEIRVAHPVTALQEVLQLVAEEPEGRPLTDRATQVVTELACQTGLALLEREFLGITPAVVVEADKTAQPLLDLEDSGVVVVEPEALEETKILDKTLRQQALQERDLEAVLALMVQKALLEPELRGHRE
jgi:hypothetical protein